MQEVIPVLSVSLFLPFLSSCVCIGRHLNLVHDWDKRSDDDHKDVNDDVDVDDCFSFLLFCRSLSVSLRPDMSDTVDWRKKQISFSVLPPPPTPKPHPLFPLWFCLPCRRQDKVWLAGVHYITSLANENPVQRKFVNEFLTGVVISFIFDRVIRVMETDIFSASPLRFLPVTADFRFCSAICLCPCMLI